MESDIISTKTAFPEVAKACEELAYKFYSLSDREMLIMAAVYADNELIDLLDARLIRRAKNDFYKAGFGFKKRIYLAYAVGIISNTLFNDLNFLIKLRDEAAHSIDLKNSKDKLECFVDNDLIKALEAVLIDVLEAKGQTVPQIDLRTKVVSYVSILIGILRHSKLTITKINPLYESVNENRL